MGTWDDGLLDNDTACDGLGDLSHTVVEDIVRCAGAAVGIDRLAAAVGVLMQLSAYDFKTESERGRLVLATLQSRRHDFVKLAPEARQILELVADGRGQQLAERPASMPPELACLLHKGAKRAPFGPHEPVLFATEAARAYVQRVAVRCVNSIREDFRETYNWSDLCREAPGMGCLAALLVLDPCEVPTHVLERWRRKAKKGLASLEKRQDEELGFHRGYYANLDAVFAELLRRFSPK